MLLFLEIMVFLIYFTLFFTIFCRFGDTACVYSGLPDQLSLSCAESIDSDLIFGYDGLPGVVNLYLTDMETADCIKIVIPSNITYFYATPRQMCRCACLTTNLTRHNCAKRIKFCSIDPIQASIHFGCLLYHNL